MSSRFSCNYEVFSLKNYYKTLQHFLYNSEAFASELLENFYKI